MLKIEKIDGINCENGELWVHTESDHWGPFCHNGRRNRRGFSNYLNPDELADTTLDGQTNFSFQNHGFYTFNVGLSLKPNKFYREEMVSVVNPGLPNENHVWKYSPIQCTYSDILNSNLIFAKHEEVDYIASRIWNKLTKSIYTFLDKFNEYSSGLNNNNNNNEL